ncbi:MAG: hypothetical protein H6994_04790 [Pseudomonadales bacterium]|nr:hypothetical protein [Pseudomonadales bacterium]
MAQATEQDLSGRLMRAMRRILRPLVRILLRNGITAIVAEELLRKVYVDVAFEEFSLPGKPQTLARVSVITGLNRKEVARLHNQDALDDADRVWFNRAGTVLAAWMTDPGYQTDAGFALDLPFAGGAPNFSDLVKKYGGDMYPRAIADELIRLGAVIEVDGLLRMSRRGYVPGADPAAMIDILGMDVSEFLETIDHNIQAGDGAKLLQIKVLASNLPEQYLADFNAYSKRLSLSTIDDVTGWLSARDAGKDNSGTDARYAAGLAVFQINRLVRRREDEDPPEPRKSGTTRE